MVRFVLALPISIATANQAFLVMNVFKTNFSNKMENYFFDEIFDVIH